MPSQTEESTIKNTFSSISLGLEALAMPRNHLMVCVKILIFDPLIQILIQGFWAGA